MHRVAIYAREDPAAQAQGRLDAQAAEVVAFVSRRHGWHVATYADVSLGTTLERPGLAQLVAHARAAGSTSSWWNGASGWPPTP